MVLLKSANAPKTRLVHISRLVGSNASRTQLSATSLERIPKFPQRDRTVANCSAGPRNLDDPNARQFKDEGCRIVSDSLPGLKTFRSHSPFFQHSSANLGELGSLFGILLNCLTGIGERVGNSLEYLPNIMP